MFQKIMKGSHTRIAEMCPIEIGSSGAKRLVDNTSDALKHQAAKFQISESECKDFQNSWELHSGLVTHAYKYMYMRVYISVGKIC